MQPNLEQRIRELEQKLESFERKYAIHQHNGADGTNTLRKSIDLDEDQWVGVGPSQWITDKQIAGASGDFYRYALSLGSDSQTSGFVKKSENMELNLFHFPNSLGTSRIVAFAKPLVSSTESTSISTTLGGTTTTISGYNFTTNELAGAFISITNSSGDLVETQTIASNTSTVVTISGTWIASTSNATFAIYRPVGLGDQEFNFRILYVGEGTSAGVRFGGGATANGQNGLLYMDAAGDIYWRNKAGAATKLN